MKGLKQECTLDTLVATFGKQAPSGATVLNGTIPTVENIKAVRNLIKNNAVRNFIKNNTRITTDEIQDTLGIGSSATNSILNKHLGVQK